MIFLIRNYFIIECIMNIIDFIKRQNKLTIKYKKQNIINKKQTIQNEKDIEELSERAKWLGLVKEIKIQQKETNNKIDKIFNLISN